MPPATRHATKRSRRLPPPTAVGASAREGSRARARANTCSLCRFRSLRRSLESVVSLHERDCGPFRAVSKTVGATMTRPSAGGGPDCSIDSPACSPTGARSARTTADRKSPVTGDRHAGIRGSRGLQCPRPPDTSKSRTPSCAPAPRPLRPSGWRGPRCSLVHRGSSAELALRGGKEHTSDDEQARDQPNKAVIWTCRKGGAPFRPCRSAWCGRARPARRGQLVPSPPHPSRREQSLGAAIGLDGGPDDDVGGAQRPAGAAVARPDRGVDARRELASAGHPPTPGGGRGRVTLPTHGRRLLT